MKNGEMAAIDYEFLRLTWRQAGLDPSNLTGPARKKQEKPKVHHLRGHLLSDYHRCGP